MIWLGLGIGFILGNLFCYFVINQILISMGD